MEKKYIDVKTERHYFMHQLDNKAEVTFDDFIEAIQKLKQQYLEDSFLLQRKVCILSDPYTGVVVKVRRLETDKEFEKRVLRSEKAKKANEVRKQKQNEIALRKKISQYKKLRSELKKLDSELSSKVPGLEKVFDEDQ